MSVGSQRRVNLQFQARAQNADVRGNEGAFETQFSRYARMTPLRGGEDIRAQRMTGSQPYIIKVIADSSTRNITSAWRAVDGTRVFNITAVSNPDERNRELELMAIEGAGA